ncbi:MAG: hypothetical protein JSU04_10480 [Bdellovibrionales bacterium]|nr:hypothetical protein [Bdellovibrionales bacterium]
MKFLATLLVLLLATHSFAGTELGDGGGGVFKDGRYMTYHSARIPIKTAPSTIAQIPGMSLLLQRMTSAPILDAAKTQILSAIIPSGNREYHAVPAESLNPELRQSITEQYAQIFHCDPSEVVLFAVTDPVSKTTALFPEFFKLTDTEQAAILFHETMWVLGKSFTYQDVLGLEGAAQAYFENPQNGDAFYNFFYKFSTTIDSGFKNFLIATLQFDRQNPATSLAKGDGKISLQELFGEKWLNCILFGDTKCKDILLPDLLQKSQQDPASLFRRALVEFAIRSKSQIMATRLIGYVGSDSSAPTVKLILQKGFYIDTNDLGLSIPGGLLEFPILVGKDGPKIAAVEFFY